MIRANDLTYNYTAGPSLSFPSLKCENKEKLLILGNSGCGKTTLLHMLAGILKPKTGNVYVDDQEMTSLSGNDLDKFRGKHIGLIFQSSHFIKSLTVKENLLLAQHLAGESQSIPLIREILANLNIEHKLDSKTERLSVGEQQRVAIARAMINAPGVLLADEPTSALDDKNCESVIKLLQEQASAGDASLVIVTHDARLKSFIPNQILLS